MTTKNIYLKTTILRGLFVFLTLLFSEITFAYQNHDLDEFDDLEKKSLNEKKEKSDNNNDNQRNDKQRLNLFDDNLNLLDDDFDFGEEELELLKLELNPNDIETYREYEDFLKAFFEDSTLVRPNSFEKSSPPLIKQEKSDPVDPSYLEKSNPLIIKEQQSDPTSINKIENLTPIDPSNLEKSNPPIIKQEKPDPASTIKNQLAILARTGFGLNYLGSYNNMGPIVGGSISYGNKKMGNFGADLMYIVIAQDVDSENADKRHTMGITGYYERRIILKNISLKGGFISLKGGLSYLKTGVEKGIGIAAGVGLSFPIGKMLIIQPMAELNFASKTNNILGLNLNIGISLGMR